MWNALSGALLECIILKVIRVGRKTLAPRSVAWKSDESQIKIAIGYSDGSVKVDSVKFEKNGIYTDAETKYLKLGFSEGLLAKVRISKEIAVYVLSPRLHPSDTTAQPAATPGDQEAFYEVMQWW